MTALVLALAFATAEPPCAWDAGECVPLDDLDPVEVCEPGTHLTPDHGCEEDRGEVEAP